jgi:hypothetical protein
MAKPNEQYQWILVESYRPASTSGLHGPVHIRPCAGQGFPTSLHVECSKSLSRNYPVGTVFRLRCKLTDLKGGRAFLYSHFKWAYDVIQRGESV